MNSSPPQEAAIKAYLLGILDEPEADEIEQRLLTDNEFAKLVGLIEDDIIDEYVAGNLSPEDRRSVETHFLRPPERRRKLMFVRLLRSHLRQESIDGQPQKSPRRPMRSIRLYWAGMAAAAALFVVILPLGIYTARLHNDLEIERARTRNLEIELTRNIEQTAKLQNQLNQLNSGTSSQLALSLYPGRSRGGESLPVYKPTEQTSTLNVTIHLLDLPFQPYQVSLESADQVLWTKKDVNPIKTQLGNELKVNIPYDSSWPSEEYAVVLATGLSIANGLPITSSRKSKCFFRLVN